ncbi:MAG: hypothetical protein AAF604_20505 [Acidobacteriota bacterium]
MKNTLIVLLAVILAAGIALSLTAGEVAPTVAKESVEVDEVVDLEALFADLEAVASGVGDSTSFMCIEGIPCEEDFECGANGCCLGRECHCD